MNKKILDHYLEFGPFTNPGCYRELFQNLPDDIEELSRLVNHQLIHCNVLKEGNTNENKDRRHGDMNKFPWYRLRCEDDVFPTAVSMVAELLRLDGRGFRKDRRVENKLVVTCRYASILIASIMKSKGVPCRVRSGFAPYFSFLGLKGNWDHWLCQYWHDAEGRWVTFNADGLFSKKEFGFDPYDIPEDKFYWAAEAWLGIRRGKLRASDFINAGGPKGLMPALWAVFYDFHSLMNNEILYLQTPYYVANRFDQLTEKEFKEIDKLAELLLAPDRNFEQLMKIWNTKKKFRILDSPLVSAESHVRWK